VYNKKIVDDIDIKKYTHINFFLLSLSLSHVEGKRGNDRKIDCGFHHRCIDGNRCVMGCELCIG